jgi:hypothetical protein
VTWYREQTLANVSLADLIYLVILKVAIANITRYQVRCYFLFDLNLNLLY